MEVLSSRPFLDIIGINRKSKTQLSRQIYSEIRNLITSGQLGSNTRLPSTRDLAAELSVSRTTIRSAFDQLLGEGYLNSRAGSGTYVAEHRVLVGGENDTTSKKNSPDEKNENTEAVLLSKRGLRISKATSVAGYRYARPFVSSVPGLDQFPYKTWYRILSRQWRYANVDNMGYGDLGGYKDLRRAIASYLATSRGVKCDWEQVIVVAGAQQGYNLIANMMLDPEDPVWVEDPGYMGSKGAFVAAGAKLIHVPVDESGLMVETARAQEPSARLALVTPSRQYPLGVVMPYSRRLELLNWALENSAWIVEDDYDSEFRYAGNPLPALQGLDQHDRTIYVGSFSKILFPALRLGYLVVPPKLVNAFTVASGIASKGPPTHLQAAVADFIIEGHFSRHIRRMRSIYKERQSVLISAVRNELDGLLEIDASNSGLHLIGWLKHGIDEAAVCEMAEARGIDLTPLSYCCFQAQSRGGIMLGFASSPSEQLISGVKVLAEIIKGLHRAN
jgi:GntR family transcriptional regulator/MocR family aminotransferase